MSLLSGINLSTQVIASSFCQLLQMGGREMILGERRAMLLFNLDKNVYGNTIMWLVYGNNHAYNQFETDTPDRTIEDNG